jgi:hypothetical protein
MWYAHVVVILVLKLNLVVHITWSALVASVVTTHAKFQPLAARIE